MTVIAFSCRKEKLALAADQLWVEDHGLVYYRTKIQHLIRRGKQEGVISTCGDAMQGVELENQIIEAVLSYKGKIEPISLIKEVVQEWLPPPFGSFSGTKDPPEIPEALGILCGVGFHIDSTGMVLDINRDWAIGSGCHIAMGAMYALPGASAATAVRRGCEAAIKQHHMCGGPIDVWVSQ